MKKYLPAIAAFLLCGVGASADKKNVIFIAIDDLRPELGAYGSKAKTPNMDKLAARGRLFERAYCQQAICSPSRASVMTGRRPEEIGIVENSAYFRELHPDIVTLPQHFISHGYEAVYSGKIYHSWMKDEDHSWSRPADRPKGRYKRNPGGYALKENQEMWLNNKDVALAKYGPENSKGLIHGPAFESADVPDDGYWDGYCTSVAIETLGNLVENDKPWFLALGFTKPHLPWLAPKRYWDMYDPTEIQLSENTNPPVKGASVGLHSSFELRTRANVPKIGDFEEDFARTLLHSYLACTSYVDAQIGRLVSALEAHGLRDDTVIVVWSDHGWHLGDHGIWGKATNYEIATRVPLIIDAPHVSDRGESSETIVELLDLYPTICELAGLPIPREVTGKSLVPELESPNSLGDQIAVSQFPSPALREWAANPLLEGMRETFFGPLITQTEQGISKQFPELWDRELFENDVMGYTIRDDHFRLIEWRVIKTGQEERFHVELYDHRTDPQESVNVAEKFPEEVERLSEMLSGVIAN